MRDRSIYLPSISLPIYQSIHSSIPQPIRQSVTNPSIYHSILDLSICLCVCVCACHQACLFGHCYILAGQTQHLKRVRSLQLFPAFAWLRLEGWSVNPSTNPSIYHAILDLSICLCVCVSVFAIGLACVATGTFWQGRLSIWSASETYRSSLLSPDLGLKAAPSIYLPIHPSITQFGSVNLSMCVCLCFHQTCLLGHRCIFWQGWLSIWSASEAYSSCFRLT